jgi:hypothetical protein
MDDTLTIRTSPSSSYRGSGEVKFTKPKKAVEDAGASVDIHEIETSETSQPSDKQQTVETHINEKHKRNQ